MLRPNCLRRLGKGSRPAHRLYSDHASPFPAKENRLPGPSFPTPVLHECHDRRRPYAARDTKLSAVQLDLDHLADIRPRRLLVNDHWREAQGRFETFDESEHG
jgi:hypothetical protein